MAKQETIKAEKREVKGTTASKRLRRTGVVPAVVYGANQREYAIQVNAKSFADVARQQASHNFMVNLEIEDANEKTKLAIVQDIQRNPLNGALLHIDFRAVSETDEINAVIPIELQGEPAGVKAGGLLDQVIHEIEVFCVPANLPEMLINDVSHLELNETLKVSDLSLPEGVTVKQDGEVIVALVTHTRAAVSSGAGAAEAAEGDTEEAAEEESEATEE